MKRVLVTGAAGFIGKQVLPLLKEREYEIHVLSRRAPVLDGIYWHCVDILRPDELRSVIREVGATHLLHLAWYTEPGLYWSSTENLRWLQASVGLFAAFREADGKRVVGVGTCAEYDWRYGYCIEDVTPLNPTSLYGVSKDCVRRALEAYCVNHDLSGAWGRIFYLYGPGEHESKLVPSLIRGLLNREPVRCTHGSQVRDYLHVVDVAGALAALLDSAVEGAVNIASGQPLSLKELVREIASITGGAELVQLGARASPRDDPPVLFASTRRLEIDVGWRPAISLSAGIQDTVSWWTNRCTPD